jgi:hypothetical protein
VWARFPHDLGDRRDQRCESTGHASVSHSLRRWASGRRSLARQPDHPRCRATPSLLFCPFLGTRVWASFPSSRAVASVIRPSDSHPDTFADRGEDQPCRYATALAKPPSPPSSGGASCHWPTSLGACSMRTERLGRPRQRRASGCCAIGLLGRPPPEGAASVPYALRGRGRPTASSNLDSCAGPEVRAGADLRG